jgi:hypothetical protein
VREIRKSTNFLILEEKPLTFLFGENIIQIESYDIRSVARGRRKMDRGDYPIIRNLDGVYYLVERNGARVPRCFSDLTLEEQQEKTDQLDEIGLRCLCLILAGALREIGNQFDIFCKHIE